MERENRGTFIGELGHRISWWRSENDLIWVGNPTQRDLDAMIRSSGIREPSPRCIVALTETLSAIRGAT